MVAQLVGFVKSPKGKMYRVVEKQEGFVIEVRSRDAMGSGQWVYHHDVPARDHSLYPQIARLYAFLAKAERDGADYVSVEECLAFLQGRA